jgi:hypothetical protein
MTRRARSALGAVDRARAWRSRTSAATASRRSSSAKAPSRRLGAEIEDLGDEAIAEVRLRALQQCTEKLSEGSRSWSELRYFENRSYKEISETIAGPSRPSTWPSTGSTRRFRNASSAGWRSCRDETRREAPGTDAPLPRWGRARRGAGRAESRDHDRSGRAARARADDAPGDVLSRIGKETEVFELRTRRSASPSFNTTRASCRSSASRESAPDLLLAAASAAVVLFALTLLLAVKSLQSPEPRRRAGRRQALPETVAAPQPETPSAPPNPRAPEPPPVVAATPDRDPVAPAPSVLPTASRRTRLRKKPELDGGRSLRTPPRRRPRNANAAPSLNPAEPPPITPRPAYWETSVAKIESVKGDVESSWPAPSASPRRPDRTCTGARAWRPYGVQRRRRDPLRGTDPGRALARTAVWESSDLPRREGRGGRRSASCIGGGTVMPTSPSRLPTGP